MAENDQLEQLKAALAGRYSVERELGHGGMATVYLATDVRHERQVAIKVLHPDLSATIGGARLEVIPDSGHIPQWERPEAVNPLLLDFLQP